MQQVAAELHLSETAFAHPLHRRAPTPTGRCAGSRPRSRPTCAATRRSPPRTRCTATAARPGTVRFVSRSGVLVAHTADDGTITLDFPAAPATEVPAPDGLAAGARRHPAGHLRHRRPRRPAGRPRRRGGRARAGPGPRRHRAPSPGATASAGSSPPRARPGPDAGYDFVSRFFAPADGIPEDPVTGSAHTALAPYWSQPPRPRRAHRPAGLRARRPRAHVDPRRPRPPHRPRGRRARRHADRVLECGRRDSNPQGLRHRHLKPACLPVSPRPLARTVARGPRRIVWSARHGRG